MYNTIFIVTPSLNSLETIDRTILSVVTQAGEFFIRYHIQDGVSTDGTVERLLWWQRRLASQGFPLQCKGVEFTFASAPDKGMYDALYTGFAAMKIPANSFMTWINADDLLVQGALAHISGIEFQFTPQQVSWVGGSTSTLRDNNPLASFDNPIPRAALRAGLCDGVHWNFLQQEGTFFRRWLWDSVNPEQTVRPLKLAGDWNLWRLFAERSSLVQSKFSLGSFRITKDQLSARLRDKYEAEINSIVSPETRRERLKALTDDGPIYRRSLKLAFRDGQMSIIDDDRTGLLEHNYQKVFDSKTGWNGKLKSPQTIYTGNMKALTQAKELDEIVS